MTPLLSCDTILRMFEKQENDHQSKQALSVINLVLTLTGQIGCLTLLILIAAAFLGRWLDQTYNTGRTVTLWLILGSLPLILLVMYGLVRLTLKKVNPVQNMEEQEKTTLIKEKEE